MNLKMNTFYHWVILSVASILVKGENEEPNGSSPKDVTSEISAILNKLVDRKHYDKRLRPNYGAGPVDVGITMHVISISAVSEVDMDFTLDFYLRQFWTDPRLSFEKIGAQDALTVGIEYVNEIWRPDTFFPNEKKSNFHITTTHNSFLRINSGGEVKTSQRLTVTATCNMNLLLFPLDSQECALEIESYGYTVNDIVLHWADEAASVSIQSYPSPQFSVVALKVTDKTEPLSTGVYSRLYVGFKLKRKLGFYMIQIYLPAMLVVVISWVSFWVTRDSPPARVLLGITTVLTVTMLTVNTNRAMPKVSYVKAVDIYLSFCYLMVIGALLEYAMVGYSSKKVKDRERRLKKLKAEMVAPPDPAPDLVQTALATREDVLPPCTCHLFNLEKEIDEKQKGKILSKLDPTLIDRNSRIIFPGTFILFNVAYWIILYKKSMAQAQ